MAELGFDSLADRILFQILLEFGHDAERLKETLVRFSRVLEPGTFRPSNPLRWELHLAGDDIRTVGLQGSSNNGLFVLEGRNSVGKTFALIGLSALLGFPWEDDSVATFFRHEERYLQAGKAFVETFQTGTRNGHVGLEWSDGSLVVSVQQGELELIRRHGEEEERKTFSLLNEGWDPYRGAVSGIIDAEFIPQNKNFLLRLIQELSFEVVAKMDSVLDGLEQELGERAPSRAELEDRAERLRSQVEEPQQKLSGLRERSRTVERLISELRRWIHETSEEQAQAHLGQFAVLLKAKKVLEDKREGFRIVQSEARERRSATERAREVAAKMEAAWRKLDAVWRSLRRQVDLGQFAEKVEGLLMTRTPNALQDFLRTEDFGGQGLYLKLAAELRQQLRQGRGEKVFPLRDLHLELEANTASGAAELFETEGAWANYFGRLAPALREALGELKDLDAEEMDSNPHLMEARVADFEQDANEAEQQRNQVEREVRQALSGLDVVQLSQESQGLLEQYGEILSAVNGRIEELLHDLPTMLADHYRSSQSSDLADLLGGFPPDIQEHMSSLELEKQDLEASVAASEAKVADTRERLEETEGMLQDQALLAVVDIRESLNSSVNLIADNLAKRARGERRLPLTIPLRDREIDLTHRIVEILGEALTEYCREMFVFQDGRWTTFPVSRIDCDRWVVEAEEDQGCRQFLLDEDPATGTRGALTVLGLARPLKGAQVKMLCVDEWGEVQRPLSESLCESLLALPSMVCAFFTRPSDSLSDEIVISEFP